MGSRLHGMTVILHDKVKTSEDPFGRPVYEDISIPVENVLVGQPSAQEVIDTLNLTGKRAVYTLGIPKGDEHIWTDRKITFFGEDFRAIARPIRGIEDMIPLDWNQQIQVERYE